MVKVLNIAVKDMLRSLRAPFSLAMMFAAPLLVAGLLYFAFGNLAGGGELDLPEIRVHVANLDQAGVEMGIGFAAGERLVEFLEGEDLGLLRTTRVADEASARTAVDRQDADVAVIIPRDFSAAAFSTGQETSVTLYEDPTLTIGPSIVEDLVRQFIDGFAGAKIATDVALTQFQRRDAEAGPDLAREVAQQYAASLESSEHHHERQELVGLDIRSPTGQERTEGRDVGMIGPIMASMIIFFVFFIGANAAESIVREDEEGTLARLFATPTSQASILGGKLLAVVGTLVIQTLVLLLVSSLLFGISWGKVLPVVLLTAGLIVSAAGFGVLLMSFVQTTRQAGPVMGGVLTIGGMLGGLFTSGIPSVPAAFENVTLATPQGWALRGWKLAMAGGGAGDVLVPATVTFSAGILFFLVGVTVFRKRFA
jgi:ABC-2 type transport system permease protein